MAAHPDEQMQKLFSYIDGNQKLYIDRLAETIRIPSVSASPERRKDVVRMCDWMCKKLTSLGASVHLQEIGKQKLPDGKEIDLPPLVIGHLGNDPKKKTVLVYGHLDVQPAEKSDGWDTEPFELVEKDGKLYGRGATDDKGPVIGWVNAIEAFQKLNMPVPINLKFCFEGMEESGSEGLEEYLRSHTGIFKDVDFVCISDNYWIGTKTPCITFGLRGLCYFYVSLQCSDRDLHSGAFGGTIFEAMTELITLLGTLVDNHGHIKIEGIYDDVPAVTQEEKNRCAQIREFKLEEYKEEAGVSAVIQENPTDVLLARWRFPSLSIHGIEGAFSGPGAKTVIPRAVIGKFSIRLVPNQDPVKIERQVVQHITKEFSKLRSPNKLTVSMHHGGKPWVCDPNHPQYVAAANAIRTVFQVDPYLTREGGSIPITLTFEELSGKNVLLLPIGASDDGEHSQNEKINIYNYMNGIKLLCAYMNEIAKIK